MRKRIIYILPCIIIVAFVVTLSGFDFFNYPYKKFTKNKSDSLLPYRAITSIDSSGKLLPYILHKNVGDEINSQEFTAIIKSINPAKDDYKVYCKSIIADIAKSITTNGITVYIFDDEKAGELHQAGYIGQVSFLDSAETVLVEKHTVAVYNGHMPDERWENYTISFYEYTGNGYAEKEYFRAQTGDKRKDSELY